MFTVQAYNIIILNHACHLLLFTERTTSPDGSVHVADAIMVAFGTVVLSPDSLIREPRYHETCMLRTSDASFFFIQLLMDKSVDEPEARFVGIQLYTSKE
jgi:hypothetical protein